MMRIAVFCLSFFTLCPIGADAAEARFFVSVGSFKTKNKAEETAQLAQSRLGSNFGIVEVDTANGLYFRVASGPHTQRTQADDEIRRAHAAGFADAWTWIDESPAHVKSVVVSATPEPVGSPEPSTDPSPGLSDEEFLLEFDDLDTSIEDLLGEDLYLEDYPPVQRPGNEPGVINELEIPELVEDAPESFKLNKLRRDASVVVPGFDRTLAQTSDPPLFQLTSPARVSPDGASPITLPRHIESQIDIKIDGLLDEAPWSQTPGIDNFLVVDPDTEATPRFETVVRMFYTQRGLYASFEMEQPPETLVRRYSGRDEGRINRDNVGITIDTSGQGRYGYWVNLALGGNQIDGTVLPERQFSGDWDGAWLGGTTATKDGWNAEIFLPWSQVAMPKETGQRTINAYVSRKVAHLDERWAVPSLPFTQPLFMSALQPLLVNEVDPRQQWSVFPYASVTRDEVEDYTDTRVGADLFWRPSSNFQMTATLNPDFGHVESDNVIVNLSSFETFFPEKRLFFQESIELFDATPRASRGRPVTALHTRRIGGRAYAPDLPEGVSIDARELGAPIELTGAIKAVGQMGPMRYGILGASEDSAKFDVGELNYYQDGSDYGVARFLLEDKGADGSYRAIGSISTLASHTKADATVHGVDYHYLSGQGKLKVDGQFLYSDKDGQGSGSGGFVDLDYTHRQGLKMGVGISHFDDQLDINDLGYLRRNDVTAYNASLNYSRSNLEWVRKIRLNTWSNYEVNGEGERTRAGIGTSLGFDLNNRNNVSLGASYYPRRDEDRDSRGNGTFSIESRSSVSFNYRTDSSKRFSYKVDIDRRGEALEGASYQGRLGMTWRPFDHFNVGASAQYKKRDGWLLWQGERDFATFATREWRPRLDVDYFLTAKQQLRLSAQWVGIKAEERANFLVPGRPGALIAVAADSDVDDFAISRVNFQLRYRWELAPLSELYVVYTLNGEHSDRDAGFHELFVEAYDNPIGEQLVLKLRYRLGS